MGKTKRKEKIFNDSFDECEVVFEDYPAKSDKRKKNKSRHTPQSRDDYDSDEDYGSFEKIGRRR